jgi:hypothetical protein
MAGEPAEPGASGKVSAAACERAYTPKADGQQRPLGIAAPEGKIVQPVLAAIPAATLTHGLYVGFILPVNVPVGSRGSRCWLPGLATGW